MLAAAVSYLPPPTNMNNNKKCHKRGNIALYHPLSFTSEADPPQTIDAAVGHSGSAALAWHAKRSGAATGAAQWSLSVPYAEASIINTKLILLSSYSFPKA